MADNVTDREVNDPAAASRLASQALQVAQRAVASPVPAQQRSPMQVRANGRRVYRVRVPRSAVARGFTIKIDVV